MTSIKRAFGVLAVLTTVWFCAEVARAADVLGYSIIKGRFLNQTGPNDLVLDPLFAYTFLASVDLAAESLLESASLRLPNGEVKEMIDMSDYWAHLDSLETYAGLTTAYGWGEYEFEFTTVNDGAFKCALSLPNTPLPPTPRLVNFADVQAVNPALPLTLQWEYSAAPDTNDFVQVYINRGHAEVFSTPDIGEPGALDSTARSVTVPSGGFGPGAIYSVNLEITRLVSTNTTAYPEAQGVIGTFSSTSINLTTIAPPQLWLPGPPTNGMVSVVVFAEPNRTVVLQDSIDVVTWKDLATNAAPSGSNTFAIPAEARAARFFRAWRGQ